MYIVTLSRSDFRNAEMSSCIFVDYLLDVLDVPEEERDQITEVDLSVLDFKTFTV